MLNAKLWLVWCLFAAISQAPGNAQTPKEIVLHSFNFGPRGAQPCASLFAGPDGILYGTAEFGGTANEGVVFQVTPTGQQSVLYSFKGGSDGASPCSSVIRDTAGDLYGTTGFGGTANAGVVYKLDASGIETVLYSFTGGADGGDPGSLIRDSSGNLYGTTCNGGADQGGVLFRMTPAGQETVLYSFGFGSCPTGSLALDSAGNLYGTTSMGGSAAGSLYMLSPAGKLTVLLDFGSEAGCYPYGGVVRDSSGNLYGTANGCGTYGYGTVYKFDTAGNQTVLHSFTYKDGAEPTAGVTLDAAGNLYGTTFYGSQTGEGVIYTVNASGTYRVMHSFDSVDGANPFGGVILSSGNLYGTTEYGGTVGSGVVYQVNAAGQASVLFSFPPPAGGIIPYAGVTRDSAGNLYGAAYDGGSANQGVVYKLDPAGHETVLYNFLGGSDGANPYAGVVLDSAGNIYGTTLLGGTANMGVVYKIDPSGQETVLHTFTGGYVDGYWPYAGVILDSSGNLYGTTFRGGALDSGSVYQIDPAGNETILYSFNCYPDGCWPYVGVTRDSAGNLYGTTYTGGLETSANGGTVYKLDSTGNFSVLYTFTGLADGGAPYGGVILDSSGNIYGTTTAGGSGTRGTVYSLSPAGNEATLYNFTGASDGGDPQAGVIRDSSGNLYGTTVAGGVANGGVVYKVDTAGNETVLYSFTCGSDGCTPYAGLIRDPAGTLYGTTAFGGKYGLGRNGSGVVFELKPQ
ncbi:MAG: choice-of-anchor tandem repeat GloVer-containing protein [Bryobacteraceae bacterium]|jgi:uncharacterized repeat protein (TIGR03803 family)